MEKSNIRMAMLHGGKETSPNKSCFLPKLVKSTKRWTFSRYRASPSVTVQYEPSQRKPTGRRFV